MKNVNDRVEVLIDYLDQYIEAKNRVWKPIFASREEVEENRMNFLRQKKTDEQKYSDLITFENPLVWLLYKRRAYIREDRRKEANNDIEINTLKVLLEHCEVDGICSRRFHLINNEWIKKYGVDLKTFILESDRNEDLDLEDLARLNEYIDMSKQIEESGEWTGYEENIEDGVLRKWGNYQK